MLENTQKKLVNAYIFMDLKKMYKKIPRDFTEVKKIQSKRLQKLARKAYKIPFYKERFDKAGVKPEDIILPEDLAKLPIL